MEQFTIYYGTPQGKQTKIGVDSNYPNRIKKQKIQDGQILEVHTCVYEVSKREQELQRQYGVKVDTTPYHVVYFKNKNSEQRLKTSITLSGIPKSKETRANMSASRIGNTNGTGNKDKPRTEEIKAKISASKLGKAFSEEHKAKLRKPKPTSQCPYCQKIGGKGNMTRYHFDNCKHKQDE